MDRIKKIQELLQATPGDAFLLHALGLERTKQGDVDDAIKLFRQVLAGDENYVGSYYQLGKLLEQQNRIQEAELTYEKGMVKAKEMGEQHAYNELRSAYEELTL